MRTNDLKTARRLLEEDRDKHPRSVELRLALGEVYYRSARDALDWYEDQGRYLVLLEKSVDLLTSLFDRFPRLRQASRGMLHLCRSHTVRSPRIGGCSTRRPRITFSGVVAARGFW